jgi:23S rRNA (guanosine2251-2'-O)-methyltransferase
MPENELIYGLHAVRAALDYQPHELQELWLDRNRRDRTIQGILDKAQDLGITVHMVTRKEIDAMVPGVRHQGAAARGVTHQAASEKDLTQLLANLDRPAFLLVLDGLQDPHNLGACLRSADAAGVHAVIVPKDRAVGLTPTVRKVASGAAETIPFIQVTNLARVLRELKDAGVWIVGLAGDAQDDLYSKDLSGPLALVMGAEGKGMRRLTRESCDWIVRIPMRGQVESLNVSVAAGICLFEAARQRGMPGR